VRIECHIPITVRVIGIPDDDQLAAAGHALARAVAARLAEADRLFADRYAFGGPGPSSVSEPPGPTGTTVSRGVEFSLVAAREPAGAGTAPQAGLSAGPAPQAALSAGPAPQVALLAGPAPQAALPGGSAPQAGLPGGPGGVGNGLDDALREARRNPPASPPVLPVAGRHVQQLETVDVSVAELWRLPRVQDAVRRLADHMANWELGRRKPNPKHDAEHWLGFWQKKFTDSVRHIIFYRPYRRNGVAANSMQEWHLNRLMAAEKALLAKNPPPTGHPDAYGADADWAAGLRDEVERLRRTAQEDWLRDVDRAVDRYLVLAENESKFLTVRQKARPVLVKGLPTVEPTVLPADAPDVLESGSPGSALTVVRLMRELHRVWAPGRTAHLRAENYGGHEFGNPRFGPDEWLGKFSFDLHLDGIAAVDSNGFYEHDATVAFFLALETAAKNLNIGWVAWYNDFSVAKEVNEAVGEFRIGFSGGGGPPNPPPEKAGSYHHGPAPYILHIHINVIFRPWGKLVLPDRAARPMSLGYTGE